MIFFVSLLKIKSTQDRGTVELQETSNKNEASNQYRLRDKAADGSGRKLLHGMWMPVSELILRF